MQAYLKILLEKSFENFPGELYNQYRQDVEQLLGEDYLFYELPLIEEKSWEFLRDKAYPLFVRYIKYKRVDPEQAHGVVVAVFHADTCYLLKGKDFLATFREIEGLDPMAFRSKVQEWLSV